MSDTSLSVFSYIGQDVRTILINGEPWFVLADVSRVLGLTNPSMVASRLDEDQKGLSQADTLGGSQRLVTVNESGLYSVILRSDKPEARQFRRWVTGVVLPEIRQSGSYSPARELDPTSIEGVALILEAAQTALARVKELEPRAEAWDAIASAEGDYSVGDAAKMLARAGIPTGPQRLFNQLADIKWTYRGEGGAWRAYADRVEKGYLVHKPSFHYHPATGERVVDPPQVRVTLKGIDRLRQRLHVGALQAVPA